MQYSRQSSDHLTFNQWPIIYKWRIIFGCNGCAFTFFALLSLCIAREPKGENSASNNWSFVLVLLSLQNCQKVCIKCCCASITTSSTFSLSSQWSWPLVHHFFLVHHVHSLQTFILHKLCLCTYFYQLCGCWFEICGEIIAIIATSSIAQIAMISNQSVVVLVWNQIFHHERSSCTNTVFAVQSFACSKAIA